MHNGVLTDFRKMKRDLAMAVDPGLYPEIEGSTDSEMFFYLALTFGLEQDPRAAVAEAVGFIEETGQRRGVEHPVQMTVATTDGETTWAFRYSSVRDSRTLFVSSDIATLQEQYPEHELLGKLSEDSRLVVREPLGDLRGAWQAVPEATGVVVRGGDQEQYPFEPVAPAVAV